MCIAQLKPATGNGDYHVSCRIHDVEGDSPALFGSGGEYDLDQILARAAASSTVRTRMKQRSEEVSALIEKAASEKKMNLPQLKQPIGFKLPSGE